MLAKTLLLIFISAIVGLTIYFVTFNAAVITVYLSPGWDITASTGVVLIAVFAVGFLTAAGIAGYFALKGLFREKKLQKREKRTLEFYQEMLEARRFSSTEQWERARDAWQKLLKKDPTNIIARVEIACALKGLGDFREALKLLDEARSVEPTNAEVLFHAAQLNDELGNKTAAIDNLALVLCHQESRVAAVEALRLSEELGRIEDAVEYLSEVERLGALGKDQQETKARLNYKLLVKQSESEFQNDKKAFIKTLHKFIKSHPDYIPALQRLATLEANSGNIDEAAQLLVTAARKTGNSDFWRQATELWIEHGMADSAIAVAKIATREASGTERVKAELALIRLLIKLEKLDDAKKHLDEFDDLIKKEKVVVTRDIQEKLLLLKGLCLTRLGNYQESEDKWRKLISCAF